MRKASKRTRVSVVLAFVAALAAWAAPAASAHRGAGLVFTSTNEASGNAVLVFSRAADGALTAAGSFATGGTGTGSGLDSQGALAFGRDHGRRLFVVNAGSNSVSEFAVANDGLRLLGTVSSGGVQPVSLAVSDGLLYVLNEGDSGSPGNISGFRVGDRGLTPIPGSSRPLSAAAVSAPEISFGPGGDVLVVTEEATNLIDTYTVGRDGRANGPVSHASAGQTPFGFAFDPNGHLVVSDASGGATNAGALSSYLVSQGGSVASISGPVADDQSAPCWVVTTANGRFAYTSNTGSGTISSYTISHDGRLALLAPAAGSTGSGSAPIDLALSRNSGFLYALASATHGISGFRVESDGAVTPLAGGPTGLPASTTGLLAG
jgi:6-phosphogluconolactonase